MQNNITLKKWSDIQGLAAVTINTGKKVGIIEDFYFEPQNNTLLAFAIKTGVFSHRVLGANAVNSIGVDAVTFSDEEVLFKESDEESLKTAPMGKGLLDYRILSEGGDVIGTIGNMLLDITTPTSIHIVEFEIAAGFRDRLTGRHTTFTASQVIQYGQDVLVIPNDLAQTLQRQ